MRRSRDQPVGRAAEACDNGGVDLFDRLPDATDPDTLYAAFTGWTQERGIELYPAQEEALIELLSGSNVILATPTGSGK